MSLSVGDQAPDFDVVASNGTRLSLRELKGKKNVVIYFYPKDFTLVCTKETCGFRDMYGELRDGDTQARLWVVARDLRGGEAVAGPFTVSLAR